MLVTVPNIYTVSTYEQQCVLVFPIKSRSPQLASRYNFKGATGYHFKGNETSEGKRFEESIHGYIPPFSFGGAITQFCGAQSQIICCPLQDKCFLIIKMVLMNTTCTRQNPELLLSFLLT
jgi:hypothetical protein